jgi:hypothetical protein
MINRIPTLHITLLTHKKGCSTFSDKIQSWNKRDKSTKTFNVDFPLRVPEKPQMTQGMCFPQHTRSSPFRNWKHTTNGTTLRPNHSSVEHNSSNRYRYMYIAMIECALLQKVGDT